MRLLLFFLSVCNVNSSNAQIYHPVTWGFKVRKIGKDTYQVHLKSTIEESWHIYSQNQPPDAIGIPTKITFNKNVGFQLVKGPIEIGRLEKNTDQSTGIYENQYSGNVDFVQTIKVKKGIKTTVSGSVTFQACNNRQCLSPEDVPFILNIPN